MRKWWYLPCALALALSVAAVGCFDSLVTDSCEAGYAMSRGACVAYAANDAGPDGAPDAGDARLDGAPDASPDGAPDAGDAGDASPDAGPDGQIADAAPDAAPDAGPLVDAGVPPDALECALPSLVCRGSCIDVSSDPDNCGGCGRVCPSGVCAQGVCAGALRGHIIAIGHDYRSFHPAMARVLGDSVALGVHFDVPVARWTGTASAASRAGVSAAIGSAMQAIGRPWHAVALPATPSAFALDGVDVLVVDAQQGDGGSAEADGAAWRDVLTSFVAGGGVVVVLEGVAGVSYRFALGAGLYTVGPPVDATGLLAFVVDGADVTTQQVVSPYLAETSSVTFPGAPSSSIATALGATIVFDLTR